jgi:glycosyltransferase involved in cell wall biosynthesis
MQSFHILLVSNRFEFDPGAGGTEILAADFAAALSDRGIRITWLASRPENEIDLFEPNIDLSNKLLRRIRISTPQALASCDKWYEREKTIAVNVEKALSYITSVDLVHILHFSSFGLEFLNIKLLKNVPSVATLTDYTAICGDYQLVNRSTCKPCVPPVSDDVCISCLNLNNDCDISNEDINSWRKRNLNFFSNHCRALWYQTPYQAKQMKAGGIRNKQVVSSYASYNIPKFWKIDPIQTDELVLLFIGRASYEKGLIEMLSAFIGWQASARLIVISSADDDVYERKAREMAKYDHRIEWHNPIQRDEIGEFLNQVDALIVPSQWNENHPMVMDYALALGVLVLCSSVPSLQHLKFEPGILFVDKYWDVNAWTAAFSRLSKRSIVSRDKSSKMRSKYQDHITATLQCYQKLM